jgi:tight adherence protein C
MEFSTVVLLGLGAISFGLIVIGLSSLIAAGPANNVDDTDNPNLARPFRERAIRPLESAFSIPLFGADGITHLAQTTRRLAMAGNPGGLRPHEWNGIRYICGLIGGVSFGLAPALTGQNLLMALLLGLVGLFLGYLLPEVWLNRLIRARQATIVRALPDVLDLLTVSVQSGLGLDAALSRVVNKLEGPLADEFRRALVEMRLGKSRRMAFRDIIGRTGAVPLTIFISGVLQAESLGVSISGFLQIQSDQLRTERRQRAQEQAAKAPVKMIFPMAFFIFPALFAIILGPALITLMINLGPFLQTIHAH